MKKMKYSTPEIGVYQLNVNDVVSTSEVAFDGKDNWLDDPFAIG